MLGLGRPTVPGSAPFQPVDQLIVQIAHMEVASHRACLVIADINDLKLSVAMQEGRAFAVGAFFQHGFLSRRAVANVGETQNSNMLPRLDE